jgi:hypothetical protein
VVHAKPDGLEPVERATAAVVSVEHAGDAAGASSMRSWTVAARHRASAARAPCLVAQRSGAASHVCSQFRTAVRAATIAREASATPSPSASARADPTSAAVRTPPLSNVGDVNDAPADPDDAEPAQASTQARPRTTELVAGERKSSLSVYCARGRRRHERCWYRGVPRRSRSRAPSEALRPRGVAG